MPDLKSLLDERRSIDEQVIGYQGRSLQASEQRKYNRLLETRSALGDQIAAASAEAPLAGKTLEHVQSNFAARQEKVDELRSIDEDAAGRPYNPTEKAKVTELRSAVDEIDSRISSMLGQAVRGQEIREATDRMGLNFGDEERGGLGQAVLDAGFELRSNPSVTVPLSAMEFRASTWPAVAELSRREPPMSPLGQDARWLWPNLVRQDAGESSAVQDFRQGSRTLTGTVKRALDAVTDKATLETAITLVTEALAQFAVVIEDVPNQVFESVPAFKAFMAAEGEYQVHKAIDDHVMAQIVAAAPPFGTSGANLVEKARNGIAVMRATGANPSLLVVNPTDAATLDLLADAGGYIFAGRSADSSSSPLWGQRVIERIGAGTEPPYLIDPAMLGVLYMGALKFEADPYSGFKANLTTLRVEGNALFHVRQAEGARRIAAT